MSSKESNKGLVLAFLPVYEKSGDLSYYELYLHHRMEQPLQVEIKLTLSGELRISEMHICHPSDSLQITRLGFDDLNESPVFFFQIKKEGTAEAEMREIKIRPKSFFKKMKACDWLSREAHLYEVMDQWPEAKVADRKELKKFQKEYTIRTSNARHARLLEKAHMEDFIDLHAEKLFKSVKGKSNYEILQAQLQKFEEYLDKAVRHDLDRIYIVHGHGKGRLREEVHRMLEEYPHVEAYRVNYNPRFGMGATEVILK